jgi:o-succinylbenzoate---CoA ligase
MHAAILIGLPFQTLRQGLPQSEREAAFGETLPAEVIDRDWIGERGWPWPAAEQLEGGHDPARPLCRVLTSGTSGTRRIVELTRGNHLWSAIASALNLGLRPDERWLCCLPLDHVGGLTILIRSLIYGTAALVHDGFDVERVAAALGGEGVTLVSLVPTQLQRLLEAGAPLDRPRVLLVGGGPLSAELLDEGLQRGARIVQSYGLTEACSQVCTLDPAEAAGRRGSAGHPLPGIGVEIDDGEIVVSGPTVAPDAADERGRLRTGDLGQLDRDGCLWVKGRRDDLIVTGGEKVLPDEVEAVLLAHPGVRDAAVFGRPSREWGSAVSAVVVPDPEMAPGAAELEQHCRAALAPFKVPKSFELTGSLPRTPAGKLLRRLLR